MAPFANAATIIRGISDWGHGGGQRILVLAGGRDRLMTMDVMEKLAAFYRQSLKLLLKEKKLDAADSPSGQVHEYKNSVNRDVDTDGDGVRLCVVPSAGHHMQNDAEWEVGAEKLLTFYRQL